MLSNSKMLCSHPYIRQSLLHAPFHPYVISQLGSILQLSPAQTPWLPHLLMTSLQGWPCSCWYQEMRISHIYPCWSIESLLFLVMSNPLSQTKLCTSLWRCTQTCLAYFEKADFMTTLNTYWALTNGATWRRGATALIIPITLIHGCLTCLWKFMASWMCPQDHHISCFLHNYIYMVTAPKCFQPS